MRHRERKDPAVVLSGSAVGTYAWKYKTPGSSWVSYSPPYAPSNAGVISTFPYRTFENCWDEIHQGPPYKEGGPFNKWTFESALSQVQGYGTYTGSDATRYWRYIGGFTWNPVTIDSYFPNLYVQQSYKTPAEWTNADESYGANAWGDASAYATLAWKKFRPGKNIADAAVFIGELRDLPRMLMTTARAWRDAYVLRFGRRPKRKAKIAADHWLNAQFGWLPFLNDLKKFYKAYQKAAATIDYIRRNNGRWVKRGGEVDMVDDEEKVASGSDFRVQPYLPSAFFPSYPNKGSWSLVRKTYSHCWFEGWFRWYIPDIEDGTWEWSAYRKLWGLELTPALVWELTPWSWLVDWFTNVGDIVNVAGGSGIADNLVAKETYVMRETLCGLEFTTQGHLTPPVTCTWTSRLLRKNRVKSSPFGFGLSEDDFSLRQWSILGALGISRLR